MFPAVLTEGQTRRVDLDTDTDSDFPRIVQLLTSSHPRLAPDHRAEGMNCQSVDCRSVKSVNAAEQALEGFRWSRQPQGLIVVLVRVLVLVFAGHFIVRVAHERCPQRHANT